jgi:hypothetical protein
MLKKFNAERMQLIGLLRNINRMAFVLPVKGGGMEMGRSEPEDPQEEGRT